MNMEKVPIEQLLKAFSQQSGLNFLAGTGVGDTKVTLYLRDVSVEDALSSILNATGLTYRQLDNSDIFIVVEPSEEEAVATVTRIFKL